MSHHAGVPAIGHSTAAARVGATYSCTDPVKWAAICDAARHWALRVETCQAASAEASRDVSAAADWPAVSREIQRRRDAYIRRVVV